MTMNEVVKIIERESQKARRSVYPAYASAIYAMKKQTPRKPSHDIFCPVCNEPSIIDGEYGIRWNYCPNCGQKIDWRDEQ